MLEQGLPEGDLLFELANPETGEPEALLDLAWPDGLQEGLSQPVAVLLGEASELVARAAECGYRVFTKVESFKHYVEREVLAEVEG